MKANVQQFEPARPLEIIIVLAVRNAIRRLTTIIKCSAIGVWILLKSFALMFIPMASKNIQNQLALVCVWEKSALEMNTFINFRFM